MNAASMGITGTIDGGEQVGPTIHRRNSALDGEICEDGGCWNGSIQMCVALEDDAPTDRKATFSASQHGTI